MCSQSEAKIGNDRIDLDMPYAGGSIKIGDLEYHVQKSTYHHPTCSRKDMEEKLSSYSKEEIIKAILDIVENAEET